MADSKRKRKYRSKVKCSICDKVFNSDYKETHADTKHRGRNVELSPVLEGDQTVISFGFGSANTKRTKKLLLIQIRRLA